MCQLLLLWALGCCCTGEARGASLLPLVSWVRPELSAPSQGAGPALCAWPCCMNPDCAWCCTLPELSDARLLLPRVLVALGSRYKPVLCAWWCTLPVLSEASVLVAVGSRYRPRPGAGAQEGVARCRWPHSLLLAPSLLLLSNPPSLSSVSSSASYPWP